MNEQINDEEEARVRKRQIRLEEMRQSKQKQMKRRRYIKKIAPFAAGILVLIVLLSGGIKIFRGLSVDKKENAESITGNEGMENKEAAQSRLPVDEQTFIQDQAADNGEENTEDEDVAETSASVSKTTGQAKVYQATATPQTVQVGEYLNSDQQFFSKYAILIDLSNDSILAEKYAKTRIDPASMTKILTVLVAAEHIDRKDLNDMFTMTLDITDYAYVNDCSTAGFLNGEKISIKDLFYGTILPSGGEAAVGLATYVAGSQETFVELMNEKLEEMGLSQTTHFTNCVGIYDEDHYSTVYDMAMIMEAAMDNDLCREVMSAHTYHISETEQHPEGINLSNLFLRRVEDKEGGERVLCAKTGYVAQSGHCAASYAVDENGERYVCVTADANSKWRPVEDHAGLYKIYMS